MNKLVELIKLLEKLFGKGAVSRTIGTRTNVVRFPKGKQPVDPTTGEFRIEELKSENPDSYQVIKNSIEDRMGDITKMNDSELLNYTANVRRMVNAEFPPPLPEADIVKFGSGQEIKGKGLEELIEKQGTKNPPTTIAGDLETTGKRLEKAGEDLKEITEPRSLVGDMLKDYADFNKYMQSSQRSGYVRATVRQIMREDIQAGKLKLPKELQDQVMQGLGEPIDIYRKVYGEGALEQIDSLADDLGQFRTEEEAAKFARSKYQIEPKAEPVDESKTYEELEDIFKKGTDEPEGKAYGGRIGYSGGSKEGILDVVKKDYDKSITKKIIDKGDEINETVADALRRQIESRLTDEQRKKMNRFLGLRDLTINDIIKDSSSEGSTKAIKRKEEAEGGRIGFNKGKKVMSEIDKLIEQLNKKTKGKKSMESIDPKTGEVTVPKRPIRRAEEPTGMTTMDPEPEIVDEKAITKTQQKTKVKKYDDDIIKAANEIYPSYDDPKIAADQIVDSYAQMKYGLEDQYGLSNKERMDLYTQAYDYVMDHNRKIKSIYKKGDPITSENFGDTPFAPSQETLDNLKKAREISDEPIPGAFSFNDPEIKAGMEEAMQEAKKRGDEMRKMGLDPASGRDYDKYIEIKTKSGDKDFNKYFDDLEIKTKFKGVISDDLLEQILMDDNPQRKAEVVAAIEQGLKMQEKGMSPQEIVDILKNAPRTKQAEGGIAGLL